MHKRTLLCLSAVLFLLMALPPVPYAADALRVDFDEAQINKSTKSESSWNFVDVNLYLKGEGLKNAKGYYDPFYTRAETESVSMLGKEEEKSGVFRKMNPVKPGETSYRLWERFDSLPARTDEHLNIEGYVEVFVAGDEDSYIEIEDYLEHSGKLVEHPRLKELNVEFTYLTKDDMAEYQKNQVAQKDSKDTLFEAFGELLTGMFGFGGSEDLTFLIKDSGNAVMLIELLNKDGEVIQPESWSTSTDRKTGIVKQGISYQKMLPYKGKIRIYLNSGKNLVRVPFKHEIALP